MVHMQGAMMLAESAGFGKEPTGGKRALLSRTLQGAMMLAESAGFAIM